MQLNTKWNYNVNIVPSTHNMKLSLIIQGHSNRGVNDMIIFDT